MNWKKIDREKAFEMIFETPGSESDVILDVWKTYFADPEFPSYESRIVEKNEIKVNAFYRKAVDLDIERMAEAGDQYAQACHACMHILGRGVDDNDSTGVEWYRRAVKEGYADAQFNLGLM